MPKFESFRRPRPARFQEPRSPVDPFTSEERHAFSVLLDEMGNRVVDALSMNPERPAEELIPEVRNELLNWLDPVPSYVKTKPSDEA